MQQRRLRLGDILDDYCPRERRLTNHVVVAMVDETVKQTRCTTCDAEHEYKEGRLPVARRRKPADVVPSDGALRPPPPPRTPADDSFDDDRAEAQAADPDELAPSDAPRDSDDESDAPGGSEEDWPVHRRLIRATLPRPEGQPPERKAPDFTFRQSGGRFEGNRNGARGRGRPRHGQGGSGGQHARSGTRPAGAPPSGPRHGNRTGNAPGNRGGRPPGPGRGNRQGQPGGGQGRKRGR